MTNDASTHNTQVCRQDDNVLETGTIPIVFVPGVMGSRISIPNAFDWDPDHTATVMLPGWVMALPSFVSDKLTPPEDGARAPLVREGKGLSDEQEARGWGEVAKDFYRKVLENLSKMRFGRYKTPVYAAGYDWRQSNKVSGAYLATRIGEIMEENDAERFVLISHSMGGLATRACLKNDDGIREKCLAVIHVAQPADGAPVFIRRMFDGAAQDGFVMSQLLGSSRESFQKIVSHSTGPIQLLVTSNYRDEAPAQAWWYTYETFEDPGVKRSWEGDTWTLYKRSDRSPEGLLAAEGERGAIPKKYRDALLSNLDTAKQFHDEIGRWKYEGKTWTIYGTGVEGTDTRCHFKLPPEDPELGDVIPTSPYSPPVILYKATRSNGETVSLTEAQAFPDDRGYVTTRNTRGDGTVPATSARALFPDQSQRYKAGTDYGAVRQFEVVDGKNGGAAHDAICDHGDAVKLLREIISHALGQVH
ncbi:hypothetical protein G6O69_17855 [Pseudenhygromyxa sp. WMMC2535]|uniref:lipase/acyltransferase domain-containing protein n=1 Tax=Pseudenhygromyxa sp. WMMC2535 TaxID=2712867 RepID=UPI001557D636|nr:hypothetical protein [Pseudenhygromyxa sp. WMMC2535]NVB39713.1 hypothetical protein [Pseudenhygromyxa sp. WMMC2535]